MGLRSMRALVGVVCILAGAAAWAQEAPPGGVKLTYKFRPGAVYHYHMDANGTLNLDMSKMMPQGGAGAPPAMPVDMSVQFELTQTVKSVAEDGTATVVQKIDAMIMNTKIMGMSYAGRLQNGKMAFTMNGQPFNPPNQPPGGAVVNQSFETKIAPNGRVLETSGAMNQALKGMMGGSNLTQMFGAGMPGMGMLVLPAMPVQVGQQWEDQTAAEVPVPLPGNPAGGAATKVEYKVQNTLKALEPKDASQIAVIETRINVAMPHIEIPITQQPNVPGPKSMSMDNFTQAVTGTNRFDVTNGVLESGAYTSKLGMKMQMALPGVAAGAPNGTMAMDGTFNMKVNRQPTGPVSAQSAKPAPTSQK